MRERPVLPVLPALLLVVLAACSAQSNASEGEPGNVAGAVVRRVAGGEDLQFLGEVSPDGRHLSLQDPTTLGLAVRDLLSGETRRVVFDSTVRQYALSSIFSPDGQRLAYTWFNADQTLELRVVNLDGNGARTLYRDDEWIDYAWPADWSPDGRTVLAVVQATDRATRLVLLDALSGATRVLRSFDWRTPGAPTFSPDGRFIAYDFPPDADSPSRELYVMALEGGRETRLAEADGDPRLLGWLPSGEGVVYSAQRGAARALWLLPLEDGKPSRGPTLLHADAGRVGRPLGSSSSALFYGVSVEEPQLQMVTLEDGRVTGPPVLLSEPALGRAIGPAWSPDGGHLAYLSRPPAGGRAELYIRAEGGALRALPVRVDNLRILSWSPDGRSLFASGWDRGPPGIFRIDLATLEARQLVRIEPAILLSPVITPDGSALYFSRYRPSSGRSTIYAFDLAAESEREVRSVAGRLSNLALSPDGGTLAFTVQREDEAGSRDGADAAGTRLVVVPREGGQSRVLAELRGLVEFDALQWLPDGGSLLYVRHTTPPVRVVERVSVAGGEPERLLEMAGLRLLRVHPDGRRLAFQAGEFKGEVWVLEKLP